MVILVIKKTMVIFDIIFLIQKFTVDSDPFDRSPKMPRRQESLRKLEAQLSDSLKMNLRALALNDPVRTWYVVRVRAVFCPKR